MRDGRTNSGRGTAGAQCGRRPAKRAGFQIGLTRGLVFGFGGLVLLAVVAVLALGFSSARRNTLDLLGDKSASTIQLIVDRIDQHLKPVEDQLDHLGRRIDNGEIDLGDDADLGKAMAGGVGGDSARSFDSLRARRCPHDIRAAA